MANLKSWLKENYLYLAALAVLVFIAYANSLSNAFVADDVPGILKNPAITKTDYIFSTPLILVQRIIYFMIVKVFGRSPAAFRATNMFFHLGNVWLIFLLIFHLLDRKTALFAAALLAVHPLATEAVTWISGGQYSRYSFFLLLTLVFYVLSDEKKKFYLASIGSFILALLVSEKAMVLPLILMMLELACQSIKRNWKKLTPYFALGGTWIVIFIGKVGQRLSDVETATYQSPQTASPLAQIPIAISSYLELIFWPKNLTLYHSEMRFSSVEFYSRVVIFLIFLGLVAWAYYLPTGKLQGAERRHKKSKPVFFWLSFFVISLLPMLTPFGISWIVAERYVYLGSIGIFTVVAITTNGVISKIGKTTTEVRRSMSFYVILLLLLLPLTARTIIRNNDWKNQDTLWLAAAKTSPSSPQNHNNLGDLYGRRGNLEKSAEEFQKAIELKPGYADAHHNLANTYQQMGRIDEAIENYQKAFEFNPRLWQSCQNLAALYFDLEEFGLAKEWMEKAVAANPQNRNLRRNLEVINAQLSTP